MPTIPVHVCASDHGVMKSDDFFLRRDEKKSLASLSLRLSHQPAKFLGSTFFSPFIPTFSMTNCPSSLVESFF